MVNPPQPPEVPKPHISDIGMAPQVLIPAFKHNLQSIQSIAQIFSPPSPSSCPAPSDFASPLLPTPKPSLPSSCRGSITSLSTQVVNSITLQTIFGKLAKWIENKTSNSVLIEGHQLEIFVHQIGDTPHESGATWYRDPMGCIWSALSFRARDIRVLSQTPFIISSRTSCGAGRPLPSWPTQQLAFVLNHEFTKVFQLNISTEYITFCQHRLINSDIKSDCVERNKDVWGRGYAPSSDTCCDCLFACLMRLFVSLLEGNQCLHICLKGFRARIVDISSPFFVEPVCVAWVALSRSELHRWSCSNLEWLRTRIGMSGKAKNGLSYSEVWFHKELLTMLTNR